MFWSSAVLTGNRTHPVSSSRGVWFWSSAVLTGNRTLNLIARSHRGFGAVPF